MNTKILDEKNFSQSNIEYDLLIHTPLIIIISLRIRREDSHWYYKELDRN